MCWICTRRSTTHAIPQSALTKSSSPLRRTCGSPCRWNQGSPSGLITSMSALYRTISIPTLLLPSTKPLRLLKLATSCNVSSFISPQTCKLAQHGGNRDRYFCPGLLVAPGPEHAGLARAHRRCRDQAQCSALYPLLALYLP